MKIAIIGSRTFNDYSFLKNKIDEIILNEKEVIVISGGAKGADTLAKNYAKEKNFELIEFLPDWKKYKKAAGIIRNKLIIENCDIVVAFLIDNSKGTLNSLGVAKKLEKPSYVFEFTLKK